jgi:hypothetical protein
MAGGDVVLVGRGRCLRGVGVAFRCLCLGVLCAGILGNKAVSV